MHSLSKHRFTYVEPCGQIDRLAESSRYLDLVRLMVPFDLYIFCLELLSAWRAFCWTIFLVVCPFVG
jgi:hypothetical protein